MFLLRFIGGFFLLIATLSLIHDGSQTLIRGNGLLVTPLGQHWQDVAPSLMLSMRASLRAIWPWLWDGPVTFLLGYPGWIIFGIIGALLCYAGRNRKRINIYAN